LICSFFVYIKLRKGAFLKKAPFLKLYSEKQNLFISKIILEVSWRRAGDFCRKAN